VHRRNRGEQGKEEYILWPQQGILELFSEKRGSDFIEPDEGGEDLFVHCAGIAGSEKFPEVCYPLATQKQQQIYVRWRIYMPCPHLDT
jgi:hypothetical protein